MSVIELARRTAAGYRRWADRALADRLIEVDDSWRRRVGLPEACTHVVRLADDVDTPGRFHLAGEMVRCTDPAGHPGPAHAAEEDGVTLAVWVA